MPRRYARERRIMPVGILRAGGCVLEEVFQKDTFAVGLFEFK